MSDVRSRLGFARDTVRDDPWTILAVALVVLITCTPRIPLDIAIPGRTFDLRALDIALVLTMPFWVRRHVPALRVMRLSNWVATYLLVVTACTVIAVATLPIAASRAGLYLLKSWEYLVVFAVVATSIQTPRGRVLILASVVVCAVLNSIWFGVQAATGENRLLWSAERSLGPDVFVLPNRLETYGPKLIAESSPFSIGALFMIASLVTLNLAIDAERRNVRVILAAVGAVLFASELLSQSRIMLVATLLGVGCVFAVSAGRRRTIARTALLIGFAGVLVSSAASVRYGLAAQGPQPAETGAPSPSTGTETAPPPTSSERPASSAEQRPAIPPSVETVIEAARSVSIVNRLTPDNIEYGLGQRMEIWGPIVSAIAQRPVVGYGKGALGGYDSLAEEAHNQYLRELAESGVPGLLAFVALLAAGARLALRNAGSWGSAAVSGRVVIGVVCGMAAAATLQDAFVPALPNALFWLLVGLTASVSRDSLRGRLSAVSQTAT